ncbi:hypothetical protein [Vibrio algivorus]|uniref:Uncharacterized protein n=1 Tax=Vibrio algivorus TaxID=1667024 RepID=A0A557P9M3_9VIBR|nr:hypothetical protein [Vibrio algivorus]TVO37365.1 hypothetical protein FOF44_07080 [Vibrio algivorus]
MNQLNALERIGRTGLKTVRFDTGVGGIQEYTQMDYAHMLAGLSKEATAWAMYAYSNTEDEKSLSFLTARLSKIILRKYPKIPPKSVVGLVKITLREALMYCPGDSTRKGCQVTLKCRAMGLPRRTFYNHKISIDLATKTLLSIIFSLESQISSNLNDQNIGLKADSDALI